VLSFIKFYGNRINYHIKSVFVLTRERGWKKCKKNTNNKFCRPDTRVCLHPLQKISLCQHYIGHYGSQVSRTRFTATTRGLTLLLFVQSCTVTVRLFMYKYWLCFHPTVSPAITVNLLFKPSSVFTVFVLSSRVMLRHPSTLAPSHRLELGNYDAGSFQGIFLYRNFDFPQCPLWLLRPTYFPKSQEPFHICDRFGSLTCQRCSDCFLEAINLNCGGLY
jgi:hypothetical protein